MAWFHGRNGSDLSHDANDRRPPNEMSKIFDDLRNLTGTQKIRKPRGAILAKFFGKKQTLPRGQLAMLTRLLVLASDYWFRPFR